MSKLIIILLVLVATEMGQLQTTREHCKKAKSVWLALKKCGAIEPNTYIKSSFCKKCTVNFNEIMPNSVCKKKTVFFSWGG